MNIGTQTRKYDHFVKILQISNTVSDKTTSAHTKLSYNLTNTQLGRFGYLFLLVFHFVSLFMLGKKDWYDNKFNFLIIGIFLFLVPLFNLLYHHNSVRYICIILIIFVLIYLLLHFRISSLECIKAKFKKVFESSFKHF